jgi:pimeloyl-ACP methyl ester carboxylesterase
MPMAPVTDGHLQYDDVGSGRPVLLIHGHPFDRTMWHPQTSQLDPGEFRFIVPDLRGFGESSPASGTVMIEDFAADLRDLIVALGLGPAVVAGVSMGGQIAMELLRTSPGLLSGLVLADTFCETDSPEVREWRLELADRLEAEGMDGYAHEVLDRMMAPYNVQSAPDAAKTLLTMMRNAPPGGAAAALRGRAARRDYSPVLGGATLAALVIVGEDDYFDPGAARATRMRDLLGGSELQVIRAAGHLPNLERPAEFNRALDRFLRQAGGRDDVLG